MWQAWPVTVLVDAARWEWQGRRWAHLVSDESYDELHRFAQRLGKRRLGFQGDHYDVDAADRRRALQLGAEPTDSRTLVRRVRAAGLRRRGLRPAWQRIVAAPPSQPLSPTVFAGLGAAGIRMAAALGQIALTAMAGATAVYLEPARMALLIDAAREVALPDPGLLYSLDIDECWLGAARSDGERSLELFVHR